ncbi:hypothetical protein [Sphingopyxis indica]|uniref:Uncharacterized protein n=1 Tax=Sphingopyxis indica TaxID=436663 RepID=A0A239LG78_9SPHN|nr:hypothetical protein [Sphingopyxis indica]SNT29636.1 hypothetical protein SAMN06295955_1249 [Sphingopyxis indica]
MLSLRRWLDRKRDRRPVIRISRASYRKPWWQRASRGWLFVVMLLLLVGAIALLLRSVPAAAWTPPDLPGADQPASP